MQRQTLVALATFLALLAGAFYVLKRPNEAGMERLDFSKVARAQLDRIEVSGARQLALHKEGDVWLLANGRAASMQQVDEALDKLTTLNTSDFVTDDTGRFAELGVEGSAALHVRALAGGDVKVAFTLGRGQGDGPQDFAGPTGNVRKGDRVFAENMGLMFVFDKDITGWEERAFVTEHEDEIAAIEVRPNAGTPYALSRVDAAWKLEDTLDGVAVVGPKRFDPQQAAQLVNRLTSTRASELVDQDPGSATTGLDDAQAYRLVWRLTEAGAKRTGMASRTLKLGQDRAEGGVWASIEGRALPFVVDSSTAEGLRREVSSLLELTMMRPLDVEQATSFTLEAKPGVITKFVKTGDTWKVARAGGLDKNFVLDPIKLKARMRQTLLSRALGLAPLEGRAKDQALAAHNGRATVVLADKSQHVLHFGKEAKFHGTQVYVTRGSADDQAYYASKPLRDNVLTKLDTLGKPQPRAGAAAQAQNLPMGGGPQGLDSLPPDVQESIRKQLAGAGAQQ